MPGQSGIHGFSSWVDFIKATLSLGTMLTAGLLAILTFALDGRYAPAEVQATVRMNQETANQVQRDVSDLKTLYLQEQIFSVREAQCAATDRSWYARRLQDLVRQYNAVNGAQPQIPECRDL